MDTLKSFRVIETNPTLTIFKNKSNTGVVQNILACLLPNDRFFLHFYFGQNFLKKRQKCKFFIFWQASIGHVSQRDKTLIGINSQY